MNEDSKKMSGFGSHGVRAEILLDRPLSGAEFRQLVEETIMQIAREISDCGTEPIGHIKAFFRTDAGHLRASLTDLDLGVEADDTLDGQVTGGTMTLFASAFGKSDEEIEEIIEEVLRANNKMSCSIEEHEHHEHEE